MEIRLLGAVEVVDDDGTPWAVRAPRLRATLATLALSRGRVTTSTELIDQLWGATPPVTAAVTLRNYVRRLRKALPAPLIETKSGGYWLTGHQYAIDVEGFQELVRRSRAVRRHDPAEAARLLDQSLTLWRGTPLTGVGDCPMLDMERARLEDTRLTVAEEWYELRLRLGEHHEIVDDLMAAARTNYVRERLVGQLMVALHRCGRVAEALTAYRVTRDRMVEELGIEPGPELRDLEQAILRSDTELIEPVPVSPPLLAERH
ncbi:BTAD domain-containing putative transcriptional regulator [Streptomyces sp. NPDC017890]|uniref:AfsR/SARP family transcriptional regulator n=1 Tax=Streptomyces sp. NPDC017890 TaxID=3365015 RepID=UPI0037A95919